jgi:hypothetical protein
MRSGSALFEERKGGRMRLKPRAIWGMSVYSNGAEIRLKQDGTSGTSIFRVIPNQAQMTIDGFILNGLYSGGTAGEYSAGVDLRSTVNVVG